jgi:hypothetical protein
MARLRVHRTRRCPDAKVGPRRPKAPTRVSCRVRPEGRPAPIVSRGTRPGPRRPPRRLNRRVAPTPSSPRPVRSESDLVGALGHPVARTQPPRRSRGPISTPVGSEPPSAVSIRQVADQLDPARMPKPPCVEQDAKAVSLAVNFAPAVHRYPQERHREEAGLWARPPGCGQWSPRRPIRSGSCRRRPAGGSPRRALGRRR